ncbi:MAG: hypothetical protein CBE47_03190 [Pelagibacteraceae bacterium TMED287]|nr:MAG: hypothetical protein CBE47_03190 [Pelagibacteraceae bacterium TMED287]|tara:strand:+ start:1 stop:1029 length:1029 start_codon:yes stop_codon:yes gene_type:complete
MRILITGGCGFVGSNLAIYLKEKLKNVKISTLDNLYRKGSEINKERLKFHNINNLNIDISNDNKIKKLPKYDLLIDCCAEAAVETSKTNPDKVIFTNFIGTYNSVKKCIRDKSNIIFLSSSRVYSIDAIKKIIGKENLKNKIKTNFLIDENFNTSGVKSLYGLSKLSSEELIKEYNYTQNLGYIINRFGVISGPWQFGKQDQGFVSMWIGKHLAKKKIKYVGFGGYGNQVRDVIHIDDVCEIILIQIQNLSKIKNETFNIGGGIKNKISLKDLTYKCQLVTGNKINIAKTIKTSNYDIPYYVSNNKKISKFYNWLPKKNINQIVFDIYFWMITNKSIQRFFK